MATQTLANISGFLKKKYVGPIRDQLNNSSVLYYRLEKNEEDVAGEDLTANIPLMYARNQGIGWRDVGGTLPTAGRRNYVKATVAMAYLYGKIRIAGQAIKASRDNATAFAKVVDTEVRGMVEGLKIEVNRAMHGRGTGAMCRILSTTNVAAGTAITVNDASRLEPGMRIDSYTTNASSGGTIGLDSVTIDQVDYKNNTFTLTTNPGTDETNDYVYREDSRGFVMMGLEGIVDGLSSAGTRLITALQGITRSSSLYWDANVLDNGGTTRAMTLALIQRAYELGEIIGQGKTSIILSDYAQRAKYLNLCVADRRYVGTLTLDGGWSALEYAGGSEPTPWVVDKQALLNQAYFLDEKSLAIFRAADFDWMDLDGAVLRKVSDVDEYDADCFSYLNLGCYKANVNTVLRDLI